MVLQKLIDILISQNKMNYRCHPRYETFRENSFYSLPFTDFRDV